MAEPEGPPSSVLLVLKMEKLRPREGVIFPRSHSKTAAEVPRSQPPCSPCSGIPFTHRCLESGTLGIYGGRFSPFALKLEISIPSPSSPSSPYPPRRLGSQVAGAFPSEAGTSQPRLGTRWPWEVRNEAWGALAHLPRKETWPAGGRPGMHPHTQNTWEALNPCGVGDPWSPAPCVTNGDSDHPKPAQKGSLQVTGQATEASLSPPCRPTAWSSWPSPAELALRAVLKTLLGEGLGQRTPDWSWGAVWERLGSPQPARGRQRRLRNPVSCCPPAPGPSCECQNQGQTCVSTVQVQGQGQQGHSPQLSSACG